MATVLFVEDDPDVSSLVADLLATRNISFLAARTGTESVNVLNRQTVDLILLDIGLPDQDGFQLCRQLQANPRTREIPVIFITGNLEIEKKIAAFKMGADDYIVKPFNTLEMLARIEGKILKHSRKKQQAREIDLGPLQVSVPHQRVILRVAGREKPAQMTKLEFKILLYFVENQDLIQTREALLEAVWGANASVSPRTVDAHICALRRKLSPYSHFLESIQGSGYRFSLRAVKRIKPAA